MWLSPSQLAEATRLIQERNAGMTAEDAQSLAVQSMGQGVVDEGGRRRVRLHGKTAWLRKDLILEAGRPAVAAAA